MTNIFRMNMSMDNLFVKLTNGRSSHETVSIAPE